MALPGISRSSLTMNSIWKVRGRRPTLRRTCKVFIPRDLRQLDTLRIPATYEEDHYLVKKIKMLTRRKLHHWILVFAITLYIYVGALLFQYLDSKCFSIKEPNVTEHRERLLDRVYSLCHDNSVDEVSWMDDARTAVKDHEVYIGRYNDAGFEPGEPTNGNKGLSIGSSIFYCFTVITTIGYGNISPCTDISRGVTIAYACFGVPLMILVLADLGKLLTKAIKCVYFYCRRICWTGSEGHESKITENRLLQYMTVSWRTVSQDMLAEPSQPDKKDDSSKDDDSVNKVTTLTIHNDDLYKNLDFLNPDEKNHKHVEVKDDFNLPITLAVALVAVYVVVGGFLFSVWEEWTYFEAFYFVFVSMSTIGFGDYVLKNDDYILAAFAYLVLGLVLTSTCINVIREKLTVMFQKARVRIGDSTVLNVGALLKDEDHRSRTPQTVPCDPRHHSNCFGFKMTMHKDSSAVVDNGSNRTPSQTVNSNPHPCTSLSNTKDSISELKSDSFLRVPSSHRFTFYDSPYNTIQDDCESASPFSRNGYYSPYSTVQQQDDLTAVGLSKCYNTPYNTIKG